MPGLGQHLRDTLLVGRLLHGLHLVARARQVESRRRVGHHRVSRPGADLDQEHAQGGLEGARVGLQVAVVGRDEDGVLGTGAGLLVAGELLVRGEALLVGLGELVQAGDGQHSGCGQGREGTDGMMHGNSSVNGF